VRSVRVQRIHRVGQSNLEDLLDLGFAAIAQAFAAAFRPPGIRGRSTLHLRSRFDRAAGDLFPSRPPLPTKAWFSRNVSPLLLFLSGSAVLLGT